jgi:hypothetical protein
MRPADYFCATRRPSPLAAATKEDGMTDGITLTEQRAALFLLFAGVRGEAVA